MKHEHTIQTYDIEISFSKILAVYIKTIQPQYSQRAEMMFKKDVFSIKCIYNFILDKDETFYLSTSKTF